MARSNPSVDVTEPDIPDWCEDCGDREPKKYIFYEEPKERVYYCRQCVKKHLSNPSLVTVEPV
jgi:hypothetical protein